MAPIGTCFLATVRAVAVQAFVRWLDSIGVHGSIRLRSDPENAVRAVCQEIAARRTQASGSAVTICEPCQEGSHSSNGGVERFAQTLGGLVRTYVQVIKRL